MVATALASKILMKGCVTYRTIICMHKATLDPQGFSLQYISRYWLYPMACGPPTVTLWPD